MWTNEVGGGGGGFGVVGVISHVVAHFISSVHCRIVPDSMWTNEGWQVKGGGGRSSVHLKLSNIIKYLMHTLLIPLILEPLNSVQSHTRSRLVTTKKSLKRKERRRKLRSRQTWALDRWVATDNYLHDRDDLKHLKYILDGEPSEQKSEEKVSSKGWWAADEIWKGREGWQKERV